MPITKGPFDFLGTFVSGDLAGMTIIQNAGFRRIAYAKTYPQKRPTAAQHAQQTVFRQAAASWRALTPDQRAAYEQVTKKLRLTITGYNLWVYCSARGDWEAAESFGKQAGVVLYIPT